MWLVTVVEASSRQLNPEAVVEDPAVPVAVIRAERPEENRRPSGCSRALPRTRPQTGSGQDPTPCARASRAGRWRASSGRSSHCSRSSFRSAIAVWQALTTCANGRRFVFKPLGKRSRRPHGASGRPSPWMNASQQLRGVDDVVSPGARVRQPAADAAAQAGIVPLMHRGPSAPSRKQRCSASAARAARSDRIPTMITRWRRCGTPNSSARTMKSEGCAASRRLALPSSTRMARSS